MPLRTGLVRAAIGAAMAAAALIAPSLAAAACVEAPTTKAFAKWGDDAEYSAAPAGGFETAGWTLYNGAKITTGNESGGVSPGSRSLMLPRTGMAVSPEFCVSEANPTFRFMVRPNFWYSTYQALVVYRDAAGALTQAQFVSSNATAIFPGTWKPSAVSPLATKIPLITTGSGATASVQIILREGEGSTQFDSVMVDPYRRG